MTDEPKKTFRQRFVEVADQDINLKFLFDHIRNYLICGAVMFAAKGLMFGGRTISEIPYFGVVSGVILFAISYGLFWLNIFQGMHAAIVYTKAKLSAAIFLTHFAFGSLLTFAFIELLGSKLW